MAAIETKLMTVPEVASDLRLSRSQVYALMAAGQLRSVHIGRSRRVLVADLAAFVEHSLAQAAG